MLVRRCNPGEVLFNEQLDPPINDSVLDGRPRGDEAQGRAGSGGEPGDGRARPPARRRGRPDRPCARSSRMPTSSISRSLRKATCAMGALLARRSASHVPQIEPETGIEMNGFGVSRGRFALLFSVMLVAAAGNTAMQSLLPAIGRELEVADIWVAAAFSLSALVWVAMAPVWARRADRRGRRALMRLGLYGFIASMAICGAALAAGLAGWLGGFGAFAIFMVGRTLYGAFGSASPPQAVQAYIAARTEGESRTNAISAIASSFGLGTIIGPAIAPLFIFAPLGLPAPLVVFAGIGAGGADVARSAPSRRHAAKRGQGADRRLPRDRQRRRRRPRSRRQRALGRCAGATGACSVAPDRHRRRARPCGPARRDRLSRDRPAAAAARPCPAMDRDRADGRRCGEPVRAMVADPAAQPRPRDSSCGDRSSPRGLGDDRPRPGRIQFDHGLRARFFGLRAVPPGLHQRRLARASAPTSRTRWRGRSPR